MRTRYFVLGLLIGMLLAPASGRQIWWRLRDQLATAIDALLRQLASQPETAET